MEDNLRVWDAVCRPPLSALKTIKGGRLTGKSDINPQWRIRAMTETFGTCGIGWKFTIDRLWTEPGVDGVVFAFAQVSVYVKDGQPGQRGGEWSAPIPGVGGHKLIVDEKGGLYSNDEAYKMATTDALGTAMKMLGVAADIYLGNFDGSKYLTPSPDEAREQEDENRRQQEVRKNARPAGIAILNVAAERGEAALKAAWQTMSEVMRTACKDDLAGFKAKAKEADAEREGVSA